MLVSRPLPRRGCPTGRRSQRDPLRPGSVHFSSAANPCKFRRMSVTRGRRGSPGSSKDDLIAPAASADGDEQPDALPVQEEFWKPPVRFGTVPVEKEPLGWDSRRGFRKLFPQVMLPLQVVDRVMFGHPGIEPNRLFWGDNLHVMRQLATGSVDLIYIDPPFFSGRQYNVIFGDKNELRSFSDIWEGGMPGYLIWLNARLYEMKRLLSKRGNFVVHCDLHASHYIKLELDRIFGYESLRNEIVWSYHSGGASSRYFGRKHDILFWYARDEKQYFFDDSHVRVPYTESTLKAYNKTDAEGNRYKLITHRDGTEEKVPAKNLERGRLLTDVWEDIPHIANWSGEKVGYPTQKPEKLIERIILSLCPQDGTVADFFCGGGTTAAVAQRLERKWLACDQSRVAVAITADRVTKQVEEKTGKVFPVPDFTVEHWGIYDAQRLAAAPLEQFRAFVLSAFGASVEERDLGVHGYKGAIPVLVGAPNPKEGVTATDVQAFANAVRRTPRYQQGDLRDGIVLAWAFRPDAQEAADRLRQLEQTDLNFLRLNMIRIDSPPFRQHVAALSTEHADYATFLTFVQPPQVEVGYKRTGTRTYTFDASETAVMNAGAKIINVQWDFHYEKRFSSTLARGNKKEPAVQVTYEFPATGKRRVACKVQDDMGGEGLWTTEVEVT